LKLIDDLKYANLYIPYGLKMGYGKNKIKAKLLEHGVSEFDINLALETIDEKEYLANLNHEFEKFIPTLKPQSAQNQKKKTIAHMVSRGYEEELALYYLEKNSYLLDNISNDELFIEKDFEKISKKLLKKNLDKNIYREKIIQGLLNKGYSYSIIKKLLEKGNL